MCKIVKYVDEFLRKYWSVYNVYIYMIPRKKIKLKLNTIEEKNYNL